MPTHTTRIAQTSTEVKKLYKKNGPGLSERQQRQLERAADLEQRAQFLREREERSKANKKKREQKERKEEALRRQNGVGLATQMVGYSHTQAKMKKGMEAFTGYKKKREVREDEQKKKEHEVLKQLEAVMEEEVVKEPWDDDDVFDAPVPTTRTDDQFDDDLDDETLLEFHDKVMSDPVEEMIEPPEPQPIVSSAPVTRSPKLVDASQKDMSFVRLHGPVNKMVDSLLNKLPETLVELLSHDCSVDPATWDPSPSLLHKLNPSGFPPHRLRIKVGCAVSLLRDLNTSSQLSKSQHLQILRIEQERLECLVLDGQLEGTKAFLTKVSFFAKHRNEDKCAYKRIQFPIQISMDYATPPIIRKAGQSGFKKPTPTGQPPQLLYTPVKRPDPMPTKKARTQLQRNPSFKLPGLPASKTSTVAVLPQAPISPTSILDGWDDFLDTATQIARDLSSEPSSSSKAITKPLSAPRLPVVPAPLAKPSLPLLSTDEFDFLSEDLDISPILPQNNSATNPISVPNPQSKNLNGTLDVLEKPQRVNPAPARPQDMAAVSVASASKPPVTSTKPPGNPPPKRKFTETSSETTRTATYKHYQNNPTPKKINVAPVKSAAMTAIRNTATNRATSRADPKEFMNAPAKGMPSFSDFGISTQEAVSLFDDDDDFAFGSPPVMV